MGDEVDPSEDRVTVAPLPEGDRFDDTGRLGRGGMGEVRAVTDRRIRRPIAKKVLVGDAEGDDDAMSRFVEEAQITGQLDHPNVVPLYEIGRDEEGQLFFTMKRVEGETFAAYLTRLGDTALEADNLERILDILIKVCDALDLAHARGVVHRDLKPSNVMIGKFGQVYVLDWGTAGLLGGERLTEDVGVVGTPGFMPPEQALQLDGAVDARSDVYAIGGLIHSVLADHPPHPGDDDEARLRHAREQEVAPPETVRPGVALPPELCRIAMKALSWDPFERHQTVAELREDLQRFRRGGGWLGIRQVAAGDWIVRQGEEGVEAYIIVAGECEATRVVEGREEHLRRMGAGEVFGEMALLTPGPRTASVRAISDVELRVVDEGSLRRELERSGWLGRLLEVLAERFRELDAVHARCPPQDDAAT